MRRIGRAGLIVLAAGCTLGAGCQRRTEGPPPATAVTVTPGVGGVQEVTVSEAGPGQYRFLPDTITVRPGRVRLTFRNTGNTPHNLTFSDLTAAGRRVASATLHGGGQQTLDFTVTTPGQYRFVCTIHQALGQTGVLSVRR